MSGCKHQGAWSGGGYASAAFTQSAGDGQIYDLRAYPVIHGVTEAWGYTVTCREKTAGFTGDTSFCPGMEEIVRASDLAFVEASYPVHQSVHMGIDKILELREKYPEKRIIPTHMGREARKAYEEAGGRAPADGTVWRL